MLVSVSGSELFSRESVMATERLIGVDLGATSFKAGLVEDRVLVRRESALIPTQGAGDEILQVLVRLLERLEVGGADAVGVGAPSVVDVTEGVVYDVVNIPAWREVPLKALLERRFGVPVYVNNDANCFALGEKHFGKGRGYSNLVGVTLGTGIGTGVVIDGRLYCGRNCGAGEFGMVTFREHHLEYYCSGQYFTNVYGVRGELIAEKAAAGDELARAVFHEYGRNLGEALKTIVYAVDPEIIVLGGSIAGSFTLFEAGMWEKLGTLVYHKTLENLKIEVSETPHAAILGAAALYFDARQAGPRNQAR
jgi:glucokinase